jgi:diguanylate cyclase (GGDEF)-like protein
VSPGNALPRPDSALDRAWKLAYLDLTQARAAATEALAASEAGSLDAAWALWHVALADTRGGDPGLARESNERARGLFRAHAHARGAMLCDEVTAIAHRRAGDIAQCHALLCAVDAGGDVGYTAFDRFLAHNSRAITAKLRGQNERALAHFYDALDAAERCGWDGPRITALGNLGGFHQDLFNLEDARALSEQTLAAARAAGARSMVTTSAANLIVIHHAAGQPDKALAMAELLLAHAHEQSPGALDRVPLPLALAFLVNGDLDSAERLLADGARAPVADGDGVTFWAWLSARCHLGRGRAAEAKELAERVLRERSIVADVPYDLMELLRAAADANETLGDAASALAHTKRAHRVYEQLVGRSAQARFRALQATREFTQVQRERDQAQRSHEEADIDRQRLADLNRALEAKVAETELLHARLREQALRDPLTGLHNRRYLFEIGPGLLELARRQTAPLCVALVDLDHFKALNDSFGHAAGDKVLQFFAQLMSKRMRRSDVLCRHGGEEFVIVMPDIGAEAAAATVQRLLDEYRAERVEYRGRPLPSCAFSAGIAAFPLHGDSIEQLLGRADKALYAAKEAGRARVENVPNTGFMTLT